jgi:hypothetical protein
VAFVAGSGGSSRTTALLVVRTVGPPAGELGEQLRNLIRRWFNDHATRRR